MMKPTKKVYKIFRVKHNGNTSRPASSKLRGEFESKQSANMALKWNGYTGFYYEIREIKRVLPKSTNRSRGI